jgi:hypothetical protein
VQNIYNYVRCVTGGTSGEVSTGGEASQAAESQYIAAPTETGPGADDQAPPPQEAIEACAGLSIAAACTVDTPTGGLTGRCGYIPTGELACIPENGPPGG